MYPSCGYGVSFYQVLLTNKQTNDTEITTSSFQVIVTRKAVHLSVCQTVWYTDVTYLQKLRSLKILEIKCFLSNNHFPI